MNYLRIVLVNLIFCFLIGLVLSVVLLTIYLAINMKLFLLLDFNLYILPIIGVVFICIQSLIVRTVLYAINIGRQEKFIPWIITWSIMAGVFGLFMSI